MSTTIPYQDAAGDAIRCQSRITWPPGAGSQGVAIRCGERRGHEGDHCVYVWWPSTTVDERRVN